jgi:hypothetical protein
MGRLGSTNRPTGSRTALLSFDIDDFILMPGAGQVVNVQITPPEGSAGAYAAVLVAASGVMGETSEVASVTRLASLMILDFGGGASTEGSLSRFALRRRSPARQCACRPRFATTV